MKKFFLIAFLGLAVLVQADDKGWVTLYNGKDLSGWQTTGNWLPQKDGSLLIKPRPGEKGWQRYSAYLWSEKKYKDFVLHVEYKYPPKGNSGIHFRVGDLKNPVHTGIEAQVLDSYGKKKVGPHDHGGIIPGVYYNDSAAGLAFLENAFGFKARCKYPGPDGQIMHSELELADGLIFVGTACEENRISPANLNGQTTIGLYIYVDDVDAHCETAQAAGAEITAEPADQFYCDRHYTARDPEGHLWTFGQHIRDVSEEECLEAMKQMGGGE